MQRQSKLKMAGQVGNVLCSNTIERNEKMSDTDDKIRMYTYKGPVQKDDFKLLNFKMSYSIYRSKFE
jgi:hypothetical protein